MMRIIQTIWFCLSFPVILLAADDSIKFPIEQIPKLPESFETVDYKTIFTDGTLLPDRITWGESSVKMGMSETALADILPDNVEISDTVQYRSREQQWQFIRGLLSANNFSMHYYTLVDTYYNKQLYGWFKTYEWEIDNVGTACTYLHSKEHGSGYHIWLIELDLDPIEPEKVKYLKSPKLAIEKSGEATVQWDISNNQVMILSTSEGEGSVVSETATRYSQKPENMFPNEHDGGTSDIDPNIPRDYFHLLSIPFHQSDRVLRVYCNEPCVFDSTTGYENSFGQQFLERCNNDEIRLTVYNPSTGTSIYLGMIQEKHGSNHGGIFMPLALTQDDSNIILEAWMGSPGAGGGMVHYGYAMMPVTPATSVTTSPEITVIAPHGAVFYDDYGKVVYLDNSDNMPQYPQPGPRHNSGALFFRDLINSEETVLLEEENTTYELEAVDTLRQMIALTAIEYEFNDTCPKDENGYYCAGTTYELRVVPLP